MNLRPPRPERGALPGCATLRLEGRTYNDGGLAPQAESLEHFQAKWPSGSPSGNASQKFARIRAILQGRSGTPLRAAARCLAAGGLVAFPTETVYGLGADATNGEAVARLYAAKGRPGLQSADLASARSRRRRRRLPISTTTPTRLAQAFWPGPLTLVLPKRADCPRERACDRGSRHHRPCACPIIRSRATFSSRSARPVVAPSANISGHVSPTDAAHVMADLQGRIDLVIDGGAAMVGLESTIIACLDEPTLLRPGGIAREAIENVLGHSLRVAAGNAKSVRRRGAARARHAQFPLCAARARLNATISRRRSAARIRSDSATAKRCSLSAPCARGPRRPRHSTCPSAAIWSKPPPICFRICARSMPPARKTIAVMPIPHEGLGEAINDRLQRAAAPR